ncbi:CesT family type III secretion system chaperone [Telmatospirillum sp. J64-1]|uniref:CesT family type III secretion system chaperone n=1 Tax=Telmatospirillum sp. J64-1 TaxID=2502183 RepID=UPI00115E662D|nr:CesT family type III secretion system chaperone [Telmatospirillum sp. J64-1]
MSERYKALIEALCVQMNIGNAAGVYESGILDVEGQNIFLELSEADGTEEVLVYSDLGAIPQEKAGEIHRNLLEANLLWAGTGGGTLGLHPDTGSAVLAYRLPVEGVTGEALAAVISQFARVSQFWRDFIASGGEGGGGGEGGAPDLPQAPNMVRV